MIRFVPLLFLLAIFQTGFSQNAVPEINILNVYIIGSDLTLEYELSDAENDQVEVSFLVSDDEGETFTVNTSAANGDLGFPVTPGPLKIISWEFVEAIDLDIEMEYKIKLVADDHQTVDIQDIVDLVDSNRLRMDLELIEGVRHRTAGAAHLEEVKAMLSNHFEANDLETEIVQWNYNGYQAENIIGWKKGQIEETGTYIIDGHFDTVQESPGADDNGSAVAGVMEALRVLAPYDFKKSIKFIGFDLEEAGLVGSLHHVNTEGIKAYETIGGVFNFEMIGYYSETPNSQELPFGFDILYPEVYDTLVANNFRGDFITNVGLAIHPELIEAYENAAATYVPDLKVISIPAPNSWAAVTPDLGRSDHAAFWLQDMPALMLTDGSEFRYPYYHSPNDTLGNLNFTFMSNVVKATVAAVAELAELSHSSSDTTNFEIITSVNTLNDCGIKVFPNPNSDFIRLDLSACDLVDFRLKLFDINGKVVYSKNQQNATGVINIPSTRLPAGTYFLSLQKDAQFIHRKVIVSH